jgi:hypothetical protein
LRPDDLLDHLRHPQQASLLQTLGGADQDHGRRQVGQHRGVDPARVMRRHHTQDDIGPVERSGQSGRDLHVFRNAKSGKENVIFARGRHALREIRFVDP